MELADVKAALLTEIARGAMLTARGEVATQESYRRECHMVRTVNDGIGKHQALGRDRVFHPVGAVAAGARRLRCRRFCNRLTLLFNLSGAAGTGKTATLQEVHRGLKEARRSVVAVAPSTAAVEELQKVGFPASHDDCPVCWLIRSSARNWPARFLSWTKPEWSVPRKWRS